MVDYNLFKQILASEDCGYIENGDFIDHNLVKLFSTSKVEKVKSLFKKGEVSYYDVEIECEECGKIFLTSFSKNKFFNYLQHLRGNSRYDSTHYFCHDCEKSFKEKVLAESKIKKEKWEQIEKDATQEFIDIYLNPDLSWKNGIKNWEKINNIKSLPFNKSVVSIYIKNMDYKKFLQTPYWKAITERVKYKAGYKCQLCNGTENLNVHHRSYEHHGEELYHMDDLICICKKCHQKYHFE